MVEGECRQGRPAHKWIDNSLKLCSTDLRGLSVLSEWDGDSLWLSIMASDHSFHSRTQNFELSRGICMFHGISMFSQKLA